jgi:hypothetical protein
VISATNPLSVFSNVPSDYVSGSLSFRVYYQPVLSGIAASGLIRRRYTISFADANTVATLQTYAQDEIVIGFNVRNALCTDFTGGLNDVYIGAAPGGDPNVNFNILFGAQSSSLATLTTDPQDLSSNYNQGLGDRNYFFLVSPTTTLAVFNSNFPTPDTYTSGVLVIDIITAAY